MYDRGDLVAGMEMLASGLLSALPDEHLVQRFSLDDVGEAFSAARTAPLVPFARSYSREFPRRRSAWRAVLRRLPRD